MKLIIQNNKIIATAMDTYTGPDQWIQAPEGFVPAEMDRYRYIDGVLVKLPGPGWPEITKFEFRQLLTPEQKLVWDNFDVLKTELALTDLQFMQMRSFKADFDSAQLVTMDSPLMIGGLGVMASWELTLNGQPVFTQADVDRILAGQGPED